eukprot:GHVS01073593.1.p1 GENE.GHVS01073593.1~~GHVS01073593.1.p1  ORF type:complete len:134 (+),score=21.93 GHVS01073593.1:313-714(+)
MSFFLNLMGGSPTSQRPPPTANATQDETATANATANATERGYAGVMLIVVAVDVIVIAIWLALCGCIVRHGSPSDRKSRYADQKPISSPKTADSPTGRQPSQPPPIASPRPAAKLVYYDVAGDPSRLQCVTSC